MKTIQFDETKFKLVPIEPTEEMVRCGEMWDDGFAGAWYRAVHAAPAAGEAPWQEPVAYEMYNPETGHCIVDYSEQTYIGNLSAEKGYKKRPLYAKQQPATHVGPVAWMWKDGTITSDPDRADGTWMPLYTSPQPTPELMQAARQALEALEAIYLSLSPESVLAKSIKSRIDALQNALKGTT